MAKVFISDTFTRARERLGISVQRVRPRTPTDKAIFEATPGATTLAHNASHQALSAAAIRADSRRHLMTHGEQLDKGGRDHPAAACGGDDVGRKSTVRCGIPSELIDTSCDPVSESLHKYVPKGAAPMNVLYTAEATTVGGREGHVRSADGALNLDLAIPKELGGPGGLATNPEQLFAAGYAACFENAVRHVARRRKVRVGQASVTARVGIGPDGSGGFGLTVELHVRLPELDSPEADEIVALAHQTCPYSNAVRGNIDVQVMVDPAPEVI